MVLGFVSSHSVWSDGQKGQLWYCQTKTFLQLTSGCPFAF